MSTTPKLTQPKRDNLSFIFYALACIPILLYFKTVNAYALNLPYLDDYDAILAFLSKYDQANIAGKFTLLLSQHNEHRILSSRIIYVLYHAVFGTINFRSLIFIANLQLVTIFLVLAYFITKSIPQYKGIAVFAISLCLFDLNNYENADFAMAGMQNYGVIALFMLSLLFYSSNKKAYLIPAVLFHIICVLSSGNGSLAAISIILFTVFKKDKLKIILSVAVSLLGILLYFTAYNSPARAPLAGADTIIKYFVSMSGSVFNFDYAMLWGGFVLLVLLITLPITKKIQFKDNSLPVVCLLCFALASMATTSLFRSNMKGIPFYSSRYLIYPHLLVCIAFIFICIRIKESKLKWPITIACVLITFYTYSNNSNYGESGFIREKNRLESTDFQYPDKKRAEAIANEACTLGIYCINDER